MDIQTRIALIRCYYSTNNCATAAIRKYNTENNLRKAPCTVRSLLNLVQKFEETGSVADRPKSGRPSLSDERTDALKETVREIGASNEWCVSSVRSISQSTGIPRTSVHSILKKKLSYKKYRISVRHQLQPADYEKRKEFATWFLENQLDNLDNVLWTDEAYFHLDGTVYTKNAFIWSDSNPHSQVETPIHSPKLCVWIGFSGKIIVPPFFIENGTIDGDSYLSMLQNHVVPYLKAHRKCSTTTFQQDGAPPHIKTNVQQFLTATFTNDRVISRFYPQFWPPRSPDLSPCDFWYWGNLKRLVYAPGPPATMEILKARISDAAQQITIDNIQPVLVSFLDRLHLFLEGDGGHIE